MTDHMNKHYEIPITEALKLEIESMILEGSAKGKGEDMITNDLGTAIVLDD
jgi:hypothetical protein